MTFTSTYLRRFQHDLLERSVFPSHKNRVLYFLKLLFLTGLSWLLFVIFSGTAAACVVTSWYPDLDGDSYGSTSSGVTLCEIAPSYTSFLSGVNGAIYASAKQSDGKIVIGGDFSSVGGVTRGKLARLNADGTLDTTFPNIGINFQINALAIQSDGKILIGGTFTTVGGFSRTAFARINTDGSVDSLTANTIGGGINALAIQSDGKILLGGSFTHVNGTARNRIARLNTNGSLDTFAPSISTAGGYVKAIAIQSDGKILVGGSFTTVSALTRRGLVRINTNGSVDTAFVDLNVNVVHTIALGTGDSILIGGTFTTMGTSSVYSRSKIGRIKSDGSIDTVFNPSASDIVNFISVDSQERVMVGGAFTTIGGGSRSGIARLTSGGTLDSQFNIATSLLSGYTILSETAGSYLIGGSFGFEGSNLVRVNALGNLYYTGNNQDCSDGNSLINPLTLELNDGIDQNCINDTPVISTVGEKTIFMNSSTGYSFTVTDVDNVISCSSTTGITFTSSNTTLLPVNNIVRGGTAPNCTLTMTPVANQNGIATGNVIINDGTVNIATGFSFNVVNFVINNGATGTNSTSVTLGGITCPSGHDIAFGNSADPSNWTACSSSVLHTLSAGDGTKTVYMSRRNAARDVITSNLTKTIVLDSTAPSGGSFTINNNATAISGLSVTLNTTCATDAGVGGVQVAYGNSTNPTNWTTCSASIAHALAAGDGTKTVYMRFRDSLGNISTQISDTITLDTTAPTAPAMTAEPSFTQGLVNTVSSTTATDAGVGGVEYEFCRNTTNTTSGCTSEPWWNFAYRNFASLTDGQIYYYFVRARDSIGNVTAWSASTNSRQDGTAPSTSFAANTATCSAGNVTVTLTCTDGTGAGCASIQYKVVDQATTCDTSGLSTYSAPFTISGAGSKKVCYRSTDNVGNAQGIQTSAVYTITPALTIIKSPNTNTLTCGVASVNLIASGATSYVWSNGATTSATTANTAGTYTVTGTYNGCTLAASETITATTSVVTINTGTKVDPSGCNLSNGSISVSATATNGTVEYSLNNVNRQPSGTFTNLGAGTYTVYVRNGTNPLCASNQMSFNLYDSSTPTVSITSSVEPLTCSAGSTTLTANGASSYVWSNGATTSSISVSGTGVYAVTGTTAGCNGVGNFTVTATKNVTTINTVTPTNPTTCGGGNGTITIGATTSNGMLQYSLNGGAWQSSNVFTGLSAGSYTPRVRNGTAALCDMVVGSPVTLTDPSTAQIVSATPTNPATCGDNGTLALTFTNVPNGTYTITYSGGSFTNVNVTSNAATISTPAGNFYDLKITTNGTCVSTGNINALFDTTAPTAPTMTAEPTFTQGLSNTVASTTVTDAGVKCVEYEYCRNTTNSTAGCTNSGWIGTNSNTFAGLSDGQQYFYFVRARDTLLNTTVWSASTSSTQDNAAPTGGTFTINNNATATSGINVTLNTTCATDAGVGGVQVAWGNTANPTNWTTCSASIAHTLSAGDGTKTVYMQFRDSLGNISTQISDTIIVDTTAPTGGSFTINFDDPATNTLAVNLGTTCATDGSGVGGVQVAYGTGTTPTNWTSCIGNVAIGYTLAIPDGIKTLYVRFRDSLGNTSASVSDDIFLDQTAPTGAAMVAEPTFTSGTVNTVTRTNASDGTGVGGISYQFCRNTANTTTSGCVLSSWTGASSMTYTGLLDGQTYYYFIRARDSLTNTSPWSSPTSSTQDSFMPTTTIIPNGSTCITGTANITLTCNDAGGIGCVTTQYKIVNAEETCDTVGLNEYTGVIALSGSSVKKICYRSIDGVNNTEAIQTSNTFTLSNTTYYQDSDGDGYGNVAVSQSVCTPPVGYVTTTGDCLDTDAIQKPGQTWYKDADGDNYGDSSTGSLTQCTRPTNYKAAVELTGTNTDCNDAAATTYPGATEFPDGIDQNCVNDSPTLSAITSPQTTNEDVLKTVGITIVDVDNVLNCSGSVSITSSNSTLITPANIAKSGTPPTCTLTLYPIANKNGSSTIGVTVTDGLLNTGRNFTFNVTSVNDAPSGTNNTIMAFESTTYVFGTGDFPFTDPNDNPANTLSSVIVQSIPGGGVMRRSGALVTAGQTITVADIIAGNLTYAPTTGASGQGYASFGFRVVDNGGTANGGVNTDQSANTLTIDVVGFSINSGDLATATSGVTLTNIICPPGTDIARGNATNPTNWTACTGSKSHTLSVGDGTKTVFMRRRTAGGVISQNLSKTILLDSTAPVGGSFSINTNATGTNTTGVTLNTVCATDAGVGGVEIAYGNNANPSNWTTCNTSLNHSLTTGDGTKTVYMLFKDSLQNTTTSITDTIILDTVAPTTTINPNGGNCITGGVTITLSCTDGTGVGCSATQYKIVNANDTCTDTGLTTYTGGFILSGVGAKKICYRSIDGLNNTEVMQTSNTFTLSNTTYYQDSDGDGFGNPGVTQVACGQPVGYVVDNTDCIDTDPIQKPGQVWWKDIDGDDYGASNTGSIVQCLRPINYYIAGELIATGSDCNDTITTINPGVTDIVADGIDNNCDGLEMCYLDSDNDTYGTVVTTGTTITTCVGSGISLYNTDCDDVVSTTYPGAPYICDGIDNDCNAIIDNKPDGSICTICERIDLTIPQSECESLRAIFTGSNGSGWANNANRLTTGNVATWYGVSLESGHVDSLSLINNDLEGNLGTGLRLPKLASLNLSYNPLLAITSLGQLTGLSILDISNMNLSALPDSLGSLQTLDILYAQNNDFTSIVSSINQLQDINVIDLSNNRIPSLSTEFQNLSQLNVLDLSNNDITLIASNALQGVIALEELDLGGNAITTIPTSLSASSGSLQIVSFGDNRISALPSNSFFNQFESLRLLDLSKNSLETIGSINNLINLLTLDISENQFTQIPLGSNQGASLDHLRINDNMITTGLDIIAQISGLQSLYAHNNNLIGLIPQAFDQMSSLNILSLQNNNLNRENTHQAKTSHLNTTRRNRLGFAKDVSNQGDITAPLMIGTGTSEPNYLLYRDYTFAWSENSYAVNLTGEGMSFVFSGAGSLCRFLELDTIMTETNATGLSISATTGGNYTGCTVQLRDHANNLSSPVYLPDFFLSINLSDMCDHTDLSIPKSECLVLVELFSGTNGMQWTTRTGWFKTANVENWYGIRTASGAVGDPLRHVDGIFLHKSSGIEDHDIFNSSSWNGNKLIGTLPSTLGNLTFLKDINVSNNTISGQIPTSITQLTGLQKVWMRNNALRGTIPANLSGLTLLREFDLKSNQLTGTIPSAIGAITGLTRLDVSSNQLTGTIPASLGSLKNMTVLILGNNQLQGTIPSEIGNATGLQLLDLRNNRLVGTVPNSFTQLVGITGLPATNKGFFIEGNALNRENTLNAILGGSVTTWFNSITNTSRNNQRDITPPVISGTGTVPMTIPTSGVITFTLTVNENSFAINNGGNGMQSIFGPAGTCSSLSGSRVTINTGSTTLTIQPVQPGIYEDCTLQIRDHGNNLSNIITLPLFTYELGEATICFDANISIPFSECIALSDFYTKTNGEQRTNDNNWFTTGNVESWFGVNTVFINGKYRVNELLLHRNDLTSSGDATFIPGATGNNLSGVLTTNFASLPYLQLLRLDNNNIQGSLPSTMGTATGLTMVTLSNNKLSGTIPQSWSGLSQLKQFVVNNNVLEGAIPNIFAGMSSLINVNIGYNQFNSGLSNLFVINSLQTLNVANNLFQGVLPTQLTSLGSLKEVDLSANQFTGTLPASWSSLTNLESLSVSSNTLQGTIPTSWIALNKLKNVNLSNNALGGNIATIIPSWLSIQTLNVQNNNFIGTFTSVFENLTGLTSLLINNNYLDRTVTHNAYVNGDLEQWMDGITTKNLSNQGDITSPIVSSSDPIYSPVNGNIAFNYKVKENSYAISATGAGMVVSISGGSLCQTMYYEPKQIMISSGTIAATFYPISNGLYNCKLIVTDHAGNGGVLQIPIFSFDSTCGNGIQNAGETCDEGSQCDNGVSCTNNPGLCPGECRPRMTNNCNPSCEASSCGDRYVDIDGVDASPTANYDDETCDVGSYCNNGTDCTRDPSICANGAFECRPRALNGCSPTCTQGTCGDGAFDPDGPDNTFGTPDDEQCDDGNLQNGDSCSSNCREEYCGDGYRDSNGVDDNINTLADNEQCDLGPNNGLLGGLCSSTCTLPADECVFCYETCDGGEGAHNIFLLIDVSGSMQNNNRLVNAKAGAINFINLVASGVAVNPNFTTKIGLIKFSDVGTIVVNPTTGYNTVKTAINNLTANGATNFGDPIQKARQYFIDNPPAPGYKQHIILLSDGEPTVGGVAPYEDPGARAIYQASQAKAGGMFFYTIAVDLDDQGLEYMSYMSSSTKLNQSWVGPGFNKPVSQSSTSSSYAAGRAVDANKSNYSLTSEEYQARWEINMNNQINIDKINVWNRTSQTTETANFRVHVSQDPFVSGATLDDILADANIESRYVTGAAGRPSIVSLGKQGQYVRVQLSDPAPPVINYPAPTNISGLKIWLDGKDIDADGLTNDNPANGGAVTSWLDKSGNGNNPTLTTNITYKTDSDLGGGVYVDRDGTRGIRFNNSAITTGTIIYVTEKDGNDVDGLVLRGVSSSSYFIGSEGTRARELRINAAPNLGTPPATQTTNEDPHIYHFETNGSQYVYNDIGNFVSSGANNSISSITWATNSYGASTSNNTDSDHVIAEFMVFTKVLTLAERQQVEGYLANKRGLLDSLPTGHPYKPTASANTVNLGLAEIEIIGCDITDPTCTDKFHYKDYAGITLNTLYGHVFGSIHCDCSPEQVCGICGDGVKDITKGEQCDEGSYCDDWNGVGGTSCTHDPNVCALQGKGECKPRYTEGCTNTCKDYYCGDGVVEFIDQGCATTNGFTGDACLTSYDCEYGSYCAGIAMTGNYITSSICLTKTELSTCSLPATEVCDDGNNLNGDGCSTMCGLEGCGDSLLDNNGPDDVYGTSDDEECDDGNTTIGDGCNAFCRVENKCGDYFVDRNGPDNLTGNFDDETCDTGTFCNEEATVDCFSNAQCVSIGFPPNSCKPRFKNGCTPNCNYGVCGDTRIDADGADNNSTTEPDNEECDGGMYCVSGPVAGANCSIRPDLCPGVCTQVTNNICTNMCKETYCGDGFTQYNSDEECDDGNLSNIDECDTNCRYTGFQFCEADYLTNCADGFSITPTLSGSTTIRICVKTDFTGAIAVSMPTFNVKGTVQITGAGATVNVCGTIVTADSNGDFTGSNIAYGSNCSAITATKPGHSCTITQQGPSSLTSNISNIAGYCTPPLCEWNLGTGSHIDCPGSTTTYNANTFTVSADGCYAPSNGPVDKQAYGFFEHCGTGTFVAHIASFAGSGSYAGISARESSDPSSKMVGISRNESTNAIRIYRDTTNANRIWQSITSIATRRWLKLERTASQFALYNSADGVTWFQIGATMSTSGFNACLQYGLSVETISVNADAVIEFDNVSMNGVSNGACYIQ